MSSTKERPMGPSESSAFESDAPGDIILESSDHVRFKTHLLLLSLASPVFKDMFDVPQPVQGGVDDLPVISMEEDCSTLEALLLVITPAKGASFDTYDSLPKVARTFDKYMITNDYVRYLKIPAYDNTEELTKHALELYALAWRLRLKGEVAKASRHLLAINVADLTYASRIVEVSGSLDCYVKLVELQLHRSSAMARILKATQPFLGDHICQNHAPSMIQWDSLRMKFEQWLNTPYPRDLVWRTDPLRLLRLAPNHPPSIDHVSSSAAWNSCQCFVKVDKAALREVLANQTKTFPQEVDVTFEPRSL